MVPGQDHRLALLGTFLASPDIPLRVRVAGCLVMLYAQPVSRLARLRTADIITSGADTLLVLGDPPVHVPAPLAAMLAALADVQSLGWANPRGGSMGGPAGVGLFG